MDKAESWSSADVRTASGGSQVLHGQSKDIKQQFILDLGHFLMPHVFTKEEMESFDLLTVLLNKLMIRWIKRDSRYKHKKQVKFGRNPYDQTNIPNDVLNKLHSFANMSYFFLKNKIYDFTTEDLQKYFIDNDDIIDNELFCHSSNTFFFRHKMLQEFIAAIYLIYPMCTETFKTPTEQGTLDNIINKSDTFLGLKNISTFVFGLSPKHALDIINKLHGKLQLKMDRDSRLYGIDVLSPLELCNECNDSKVTNAFVSLLSESQVCFTEGKSPFPDISLYKRFFSSLTFDQAVSLLLSWYNIHLYSIKEGLEWALTNGDNDNTVINDVIYDSRDGSLRIKWLDITLMLLLQSFTLPQVHSLFVDYSWINVPDMITIGKMFPNIIKLFVAASYPDKSYETALNIPGNTKHQLTSLQHISHPWLKYSPESQQLLLQQSQLETLSVDAALIHDIIHSQQQYPYWPKLHTLQLDFWKLSDKQTVSDDSDKQTDSSDPDKQTDSSDPDVCNILDLCHILKGVPQLTKLILDGGNPSVSTMKTLLQCIQKNLIHLNKLHLGHMLDSLTLPMIFEEIGNMKKLTNLGLYYEDIDGNIESLVDGLSTVKNIKQLEMLYYINFKSLAQTTINKTKQYKKSKYPDMCIEVSCTRWHYTYLQTELPKLHSISPCIYRH